MGRRVGEIRRKLGWTQAEFADRAGKSVNYIQRIEQGRSNLTVHTLVRLANVLQTPAWALLTSPERREPWKRGRPTERERSQAASKPDSESPA